MRHLEQYNNPHQAMDSVHSSLNKALDTLDNKWILEAGCGSLSRLSLPDGIKLAGIDVSQQQLDRNTKLSEKICGDIASYPLVADKYHICICWNVLEHLTDPDAAIGNLCNALAKDGYLILAVPNIHSLKGLVTKYTPHSFHVWYYRTILGSKSAGRPDRAPFKAYLNPHISATTIQEQLDSFGFQVEKQIFFDSMVYRLKKSHYPLYLIYRSFSEILNLLSFGKRGGKNNSDLIVVAKKKSK